MKKNELSNEELSTLFQELSQLYVSMDTGVALSYMAEDAKDPALLNFLQEQVDGGAPLSTAIRNSGRFPIYACGLLETADETGGTEEALASLAKYYEKRFWLSRRIRSALLYPAVMLLLMLVVIAVLLVKVLPIFDDVYASLGGRLSGVAGGLLQIGQGLDKAMPLLWALLALAALALAAFALIPSFREKLTGFWQKHWGDKGVSRKMNDAHVAQAMAMAMAPGDISMERVLELTSGLVEGGAKQRCLDCMARLENNESIGEAARASGLLPNRFCRLLELSQRSGGEGKAMEEISQSLSNESEAALEETVGRVEPALVLVCSILVGLILLSVMLPLMHIMSAIG